jgi:hypothetical protein
MTDQTILDVPPVADSGVVAPINYVARTGERPRYYANDHSRDVLTIEPHRMSILDARTAADAPALDREGFALVAHRTAVKDFRDAAAVAAIHPGEIRRLLLDLTGADEVVVNGSGILRFGERSADAGRLNNSLPARFAHIDISDPTAETFGAASAPEGRTIRRRCHYNVWRSFSGAPQDVPLALCDARTLQPADLIEADAIFDPPGGAPEWSFEGLVIAHNPAHRWCYFRDMTPDEAIVFKTNDSDRALAHHVPHVAFDDPSCPPGVPPRASVEMRAVAYWFGN